MSWCVAYLQQKKTFRGSYTHHVFSIPMTFWFTWSTFIPVRSFWQDGADTPEKKQASSASSAEGLDRININMHYVQKRSSLSQESLSLHADHTF